NFRKSDAIPTKNLPATATPWILIILGLGVIVAAAAGLVSDGARPGALAATGLIGLVAIGASLVLSVPAKTQAVDNITNSFRTPFRRTGVATARQYMDTVSSLATEVQDRVVPALATALHTTDDQLTANLGRQFPAVGAVLTQLPALVVRFDGLVSRL